MKKSTIILLIVVIAATAVLIYIFASGILWGNTSFGPSSSETATSAATESAPTQEPSSSPSPTATATMTSSASPSPTVSLEAEDDVEYKDNKLEYDYYDIIDDEEKTEIIEVDTKEPLQYPLSVVAMQFFNKELADSPIKPNSIVLTGSDLSIDFTSAILQAGLGSSVEDSLLNAVADIYLNNIDGLNAVYISVDGGDYSSGHFEFSKNEPFKTKADL